MANNTVSSTLISRLLPFISPNTLITILISTIIIIFMFIFIIPPKQRKPPLPPGPTRWPFIGSLIPVLFTKSNSQWVRKAAESNDISYMTIGALKVVVVNCPQIAREFCRTHDLMFSSRPLSMSSSYYSRGYLGLIVSPLGDQWEKMRKVVLVELLNPSRMKRTVNLRAEEADHIVRYIYRQCMFSDDVNIDVRLGLRYFCGCLLRRMIFGRRHFGEGGAHGGPSEDEIEHVEAAFTITNFLYAFSLSDLVPWLGWLDLDGHGRSMKEAVGVMNKYHDPIIEERIEKRRRKGGDHIHGWPKEEMEDLLDLMIGLKNENGEPLLSVDEIKVQVAELFLAAVDNPSNVVEWAIAELINQPEILRRAVAELDDVVGMQRLVQESDLSKLHFIRSIARESMRLHPVTAFNLPHHSTADTVVAGYHIPKGTSVLLSRVGLGRNPKVWEEPTRFNPDRHGRNAELAEPELRFISFTAGRRRCKGAQLGSVMTYLMLARLLQCFDWSPPPGIANVDLTEGPDSFYMAKPLLARAKPRLDILGHL
ncbi:hypothetical protein J5N97_002622 [Dioscorea zingiberensis]|uniref:Cytochrome P450 n=1 Tax=Dioscorea zingiberensis TaxID=325984 RepID=A0A9D5D328_9LILI|nr:hypothetical protein J5N97_002622 [Dioscorea zingiberensis]